VLTDLPVGSWTGAFALDGVAALTGSEQAGRAADGALAFGIASAVPAAVTGTSDYRDLWGEERRIATVHGLLNVVGLGLNVASLVQRRRGRRGAGWALSSLGLLVSGGAAHLGGDLSFGLGVRVNRTLAAARPAEFTAVLDEAALDGAAMQAVELDGTPVLVARSQSGGLCAIASTCSHLGGPLAEGSRDGDVVTCPWHGSRFDLCSGHVVEGPAVFPQPAYEARIRDGKVELRAAPER
jgi:nitrite reductase/ring-hydroxylating ferredoxin subunit